MYCHLVALNTKRESYKLARILNVRQRENKTICQRQANKITLANTETFCPSIVEQFL